MEKVNNMQEEMGNVSREMDTLSENQKDILQIKNTETEWKNAFDDSSKDQIQLKKEFMSLKKYQGDVQTGKQREKIMKETEQNIQGL